MKAAHDGCNVIIWFAINLVKDANGNQEIQGGPDMDCVAGIVLKLKSQEIEVAHLISVGGWNAPHIDASFSSSQWWAFFKKWNSDKVSKPEQGFFGFDGIDWDLEGNDDLASPFNVLSKKQLDLMGEISVHAKRDGCPNPFFSIVPANINMAC